jgi:hypothetical protein
LKGSKSIIKNKLLLELDDLLVIKIIVVVAGLKILMQSKRWKIGLEKKAS